MSYPLAPTLGLVALLGPVQDPEAPSLEDTIAAFIEPYAEAGLVSGTVLVAGGGEVLFERAYGMAHVELGVPNTVDTRHCIASITKPMTLVIGIKLLEDGKLGQDDKLEKWIPGFTNGDKITVGHLLRHRAGIPHRVTTAQQETVPRTAADMVELARDHEPLCEPGSQHIYSSAGYSVLARVLELAGGEPYEELLEEYVCAPAKLKNTVHTSQRDILPNRAQCYLPGIDGVRNAPLKDFSFLVGAGSVYSTAGDLFLLVRAVVDGTFGQSVRTSMLQGGLDWNGATTGFRAYADYHPDTDVTVVFTGNLPSGANDVLRGALPRLAVGEEVEAVPVPECEVALVADADLQGLEGVYEMRPGSTFDVRARDGAIYVNDWILLPVGEGRFYSPQDFGEVTFELEDGAPTVMNWVTAGQPSPMRRIGDLGDE